MDASGLSGADEVLSAFDAGHLTPEQRDELSDLLTDYDIPHDHVGAELHAPAAESETVEDLITYVRTPPGERPAPPSPLGRSPEPSSPALSREVGARWRRFVAFVVEGYLLIGLVWIVRTFTTPTNARGVGLALGIISGLVLVARTGRTAGMWMFRMRVVVQASHAPPGWRTALVRFLVVTAPAYVGLIVEPFVPLGVVRALHTADLVWIIACFGPILFDDFNRGLHDRAAGTVVINAGRVDPLPLPHSSIEGE